MTSDPLQPYMLLSQDVGVSIPELLCKLILAGYTSYGSDWKDTWQSRMLSNPPALISSRDFEWLQPDECKEQIEGWLRPAYQFGHRFLPFGITGAGDSYCLTPTSQSEAAIAFVPHDNDEAHLVSATFDDFVFGVLLDGLSNLEHLLDEFSEDEAVKIVEADVSRVSKFMTNSARTFLAMLVHRGAVYRGYKDGPRSQPREVLSFLSQDELLQAEQRLPQPLPATFPITPRWKVPSGGAPEPVHHTWATLAENPALRFQALRAYQAEFEVGLLEAKRAIDLYLLNRRSRT
jgi:hypothetical protein